MTASAVANRAASVRNLCILSFLDSAAVRDTITASAPPSPTSGFGISVGTIELADPQGKAGVSDKKGPLVRVEPCLCMVLWLVNSAYVAGVHAPAKPVCGRHVVGTVV